MLENPCDSSSTANIATIKRYAPPNQRNRSLGRRKSGGGGDRFERASIFANDGEKSRVAASRNAPIVDKGYAVRINLVKENPYLGLISLHGCCDGEAFQLLNDRWTAAMNAYNNPSIDLAERPVMYSGSSASAWGNFKLPYQLMTQSVVAGASGSQIDFTRHEIHDANACT